jgi:hypothetical protein
MAWSDFFRDFLSVGAMVSAVYLGYFVFIPSKFTRWESWQDKFKNSQFGLGYISSAILLLRGIVWAFDRFHHGS